MPDPALLKLVATANSLLIGVMALVILACLAVFLAVLCFVLLRLRQISRRELVTGEIMAAPDPDIIEGVFVDSVFVDAGTLALSRRAYTR